MPHTTKLNEENVFWLVTSVHSWQGGHGRTAHIMVVRKGEGGGERHVHLGREKHRETDIQRGTETDSHKEIYTHNKETEGGVRERETEKDRDGKQKDTEKYRQRE